MNVGSRQDTACQIRAFPTHLSVSHSLLRPMSDRATPDKEHSFRARLLRLAGDGVDPRIALDGGGGPESEPGSEPGSGTVSGGKTAGMLGRLGSHATASARYRVKGEIARGGMGVILEVWDEDLRRRLAMKVALEGGEQGSTASADKLDPRVLSRFLEEAQVTGQLEHPGIVPVHELGLGENGEVFFTMRLVRGRDLKHVFGLVDEARENWTRTRAIEVLLKVCDAMAYAHSKGVLHRDLKPANVMVGRFGEVYVMDWGLVRVRGHEDRHDVRINEPPTGSVLIESHRREDASGESGTELYTMDGDVIGTPSYMAPEQARGLLDLLDERADVYSVGAMLYRLLAGGAPYATRGGESRGILAILNDLLEGPPDPLEKIVPGLPPELVAICEKAMARKPANRYEDMRSLADDLRAFLEHRVVGAYETGAIAEARKWVTRNRPLAAALAAGVLALAIGLIAALMQKARADDNALLAADRRVEAERQARIAEEVNSFLNNDLFASISPEEMGIDVTVREVIDGAAVRLEGRFEDEPLVDAALRYTLGLSYDRLGEYKAADALLDRALEIQHVKLAADDDALVETMRAKAGVLLHLGENEDASALYRDVLGRLEARFGPEGPKVLGTRNGLALATKGLGRPKEALSTLEDIAQIQLRVVGEAHPDRLITLNNIANVLIDLGDYKRGIAVAQKVVDARQRADGPDHPETITAMSNLAELLLQDSQYEEAESCMRATNDALARVHGSTHSRYGQGLSNLGVLLLERGRMAEALEELKKAKEVLDAALSEEHPVRLLNENNLAVVYTSSNRLEDALEVRETTLALQREHLGEKHPDSLLSMGNAAMLYRFLGRLEDAEALLQKTLKLRREVSGPDHPETLVVLENLAGLMFFRGEHEASLELTEQVLKSRRRVLGDDHRDVAKTTYNMGMAAKAMKKPELARSYFQDAAERFKRSVGVNNSEFVDCQLQLGYLAQRSKDPAAAEAHFLRGLKIARDLGPVDARTAELMYRAMASAFKLEKYEAAIALGEEVVPIRKELLGPDNMLTLASVYMVARARVRAGRFAEAEPGAREFHDRSLATYGAEHDYIARARKLLVELYEGWGKEEQAALWR